jgi:hypothetical protein
VQVPRRGYPDTNTRHEHGLSPFPLTSDLRFRKGFAFSPCTLVLFWGATWEAAEDDALACGERSLIPVFILHAPCAMLHAFFISARPAILPSSSRMSPDDIRERFNSITVWKRGGERAPHKPLLYCTRSKVGAQRPAPGKVSGRSLSECTRMA